MLLPDHQFDEVGEEEVTVRVQEEDKAIEHDDLPPDQDIETHMK